MKTITIKNETLSVEIPETEWQKSVESARLASAQRGHQTPEQWARGIILNREARRRQIAAEKERIEKKNKFIQDHAPQAWVFPITRCLDEFLPTGYYTLDPEGLLADTGVRHGWEAVADIGILYLATEHAGNTVDLDHGQADAMRRLDADCERNVMPMAQFDHLQRVLEPYNQQHHQTLDEHRKTLRLKFGVKQQLAQ